MSQVNTDFREYAKSKGARFWQIADKLGVSEATFTRMMRHELTAEEKRKMMKAVDEIKNQ